MIVTSPINFTALNEKWTGDVNAYDPVSSELNEVPLSEAIGGIQVAGEGLIKQIGARTGVYGDVDTWGSNETDEAAKFAKQARAVSELQQVVGETKAAYEVALETLRLPKGVEAFSSVLGKIDSELPSKIEESVGKIKKLEGRVEKLAIAEKELIVLIPKINAVWSKYIKQFNPSGSASILSYFSWSTASPEPKNLIFKGGTEFEAVCKQSSELQAQLMQATNPADLGKYLKSLSAELSKLGLVLDPTDSRGGGASSTDVSTTETVDQDD